MILIHFTRQEKIEFSPRPIDLSRSSRDADNLPVMLTFEPNERACAAMAPGDKRCQKVIFNWKVIKTGLPIYTFDLGLIRFFAHRYRMYRTEYYDLVDYMVRLYCNFIKNAAKLAYSNFSCKSDGWIGI